MVFQRYKSEISKHRLFWKEPPESVNLLSEKKLNNSKINCVHCNEFKNFKFNVNSSVLKFESSSFANRIKSNVPWMDLLWLKGCPEKNTWFWKYMEIILFINIFFLCHINILIYFYCVLHTFWFIKFVCLTFKYFTYLLQNTFNCLITLIKFDVFFI